MKKEDILYWHTVLSKNDFSFITSFSHKHATKHPLVIFYNQYDQKIYYLQGQSYEQDKHKLFVNKTLVLVKEKKDFKNFFIYQDTVFDCTTIHEMNIEDFVDNFELDKTKKYHLLNEEKQEELITLLYRNVIVNDNFCVKRISIEELPNKELITHSEYHYVSYSYLKRILGHLKQPYLLKRPRDELSRQVGFNLVNMKGSYSNMLAIVNELFESCNQQTQKRILQNTSRSNSL